MKLETIIDTFLAPYAPLSLSESWDNTGLLIGDRNRDVNRVMTCLTISEQTISEAISGKADLIVSHHPFPFHSSKRFTADSPFGANFLALTGASIAVYSPHTAFDSAKRGINQRIAEKMNLTQIRPIELLNEEDQTGIGRLGIMPPEEDGIPLAKFSSYVKKAFELDCIGVVGHAQKPVHRVAVTCGAAGSLFEKAAEAGADTILLGETNFHTYLEALDAGISLVMPGHYATERFAVVELADDMAKALPELHVWAAKTETDPLWFFSDSVNNFECPY